jgi:hypothetical protein
MLSLQLKNERTWMSLRVCGFTIALSSMAICFSASVVCAAAPVVPAVKPAIDIAQAKTDPKTGKALEANGNKPDTLFPEKEF